jgi:hypothetical protein
VEKQQRESVKVTKGFMLMISLLEFCKRGAKVRVTGNEGGIKVKTPWVDP